MTNEMVDRLFFIRKLHRGLALGGALLVAVSFFLFQNCLGPAEKGGSGAPGGESVPLPSITPENQSGNGTGYGGKLVVELLANGSVCPDYTTVNRRIEIVKSSASGTVATLVRDNCADLSPAQTVALPAPVQDFNTPTVVVDGKEYQVEALLGNGRGQLIQNLAGDYAPSIASANLPPASAIEGAPLGNDHFFVAITQDQGTATGSEIILFLYRKSGVGLDVRQELHLPIATAFGLTDYRRILGAFAFDDTHAVLIVRGTPFVARALLIKRTGDSIAVVDNSTVLGDAYFLKGQLIDSRRYLLTYKAWSGAQNRIGLRVISLADDEHLGFGVPLVFNNIAARPTGETSLLATTTPGVFEAYTANVNYDFLGDKSPTGEANMVRFTVQVNGTSVSGGGDLAPFGSTTDLLSSAIDCVGDAASALLSFQSPNLGFLWAALTGGAYQMHGQIASTAGSYVGPMNMLGALNLRVGGRTYFRLPSDTGTRIYYLDSLSSAPRLYNTAFPRSADFNMSRLFSMGNDLILLEAERALASAALPGHVHVLSTPP